VLDNHTVQSLQINFPSDNRTNAKACSYVQLWAKDPMTFELFSALAASAGSAKNPEIGNVLDEMVHTCIKLGLFNAPTVGTATQVG
jgi:hypothetical protein